MTQLSQEYFEEKIDTLATKKDLQDVHHAVDGVRTDMGSLRTEMNEGFTKVDIKLDAMLELLNSRKALRNLVHEIQAQGIKLDETKIFIS